MTTQTLNPNSTWANNGAIVGSGGTVHGSLADSTDANYVSYDDTEGSIVELSSYTLTAGQLVSGVRANFRARGGSPAGTLLGQVGYTPNFWIAGTQVAWTPSVLFADYTSTFVSIGLSQSQINDLVLAVTAAGGVVDVTKASLSLIIAEPPTVSVSSPTGTIGTPTPNVQWTYTQGSDGGPQSKYRVKVFTAAQYGAGGFDPETSGATYDSGTLTGAAANHVVATPLANSTTFRAYVKVTHTINSTDASSSWAFSGFTTSFATSDVSSVTCAPNNSTGAVTLTIARNTGTQAWAMIEVQRSVDGGVTWRPVRGATRKGAINTWLTAWSANSATVVDYELGNGVTATYRARAIHSNSGSEVIGPWTTSSSTSWTSTSTFVKDPLNPTRNTTFRLAVMPSQQASRPQGVFDVLGRSAPIVVSDARKEPVGSLTIHTPNSVTAAALDTLSESEAWLLHGPATHRLPGCIAPGAITEVRATRVAVDGNRYWEISYHVIDAPADDT